MPIKPENRARYPADWPAISLAARERAGWRCQHPGCKARQYSIGVWHRPGGAEHQWAEQYEPPASYGEARQIAADAYWEVQHCGGDKLTIIVLTVAHLDHQPENCAPENLRALCQRHHLAYDSRHHQQSAWMTRRKQLQTVDLFADLLG
jgi:hypothetical protein